MFRKDKTKTINVNTQNSKGNKRNEEKNYAIVPIGQLTVNGNIKLQIMEQVI